MAKRILMIAYHYPPILHSSGVHRTAKFVQYLPEYGWNPDVLTVNQRAYEVADTEVPPTAPNITETRSFALDTARHLSIKGRYFGFMSRPDRWISWILSAIPSGLRIIRNQKPKLIWSTYPIATAHLIAFTLHKITGIPWIADFRDPMTDEDYPSDEKTRKQYLWIEKKAIEHCTHAVFTTTDTQAMYIKRYPNIPAEKFHVIPNGFDEETFKKIEDNINQNSTSEPDTKPLYFVHSGILYPSERNPLPFFNALAELKQSGMLSAENLKVALRASGNEENYRKILEDSGIEDIVSLESSLSYDKAIAEMMQADGLLLFQAANCNHQIPAKAYEYMRARRPIFALTDRHGNTANLLTSSGIDTIVNIENKEEIKSGLLSFIDSIKTKKAPIAKEEIIQSFSRKSRTRELSEILDLVK